MVWNLEDIPGEPMVIAMLVRRIHHVLPAIPRGIGGDQEPGQPATVYERSLQDQAIVIPVEDTILHPFRKWGGEI